jgi:hypothetical protein
MRNVLGKVPEWPNVPRTLYIGHEKHQQMKLYPVPPDKPNEPWAQPYSIRSFVSQASSRLGGCLYWSSAGGSVMGESVFVDRCADAITGDFTGPDPCDFLAGFTIGREKCPLWEKVATLCQTETETKFLHWYLTFVKDRQFPMLIPQVRIGIAERRRPDFVLFVPLQYWRYKWYAIQLDGSHPPSTAEQDKLRDDEIAVHGYEIISLCPERQGYLEEVRRLVERVESQMATAETEPFSVALEVPVTRTEEPPEPF